MGNAASVAHRVEGASSPDPGDDGSHTLLHAAAWWLVTLVVLVILDDLTFGPFFWALSRIGGPWVAFIAALCIYIPAQIVLVFRATSDQPGRVASFFLRRFDLERRSPHVAAREQRLRARVTGIITAVPMSLVIGGVLPPLALQRAGYGVTFVRRLSIVTSTLYALEFATLHGLLPGSL